MARSTFSTLMSAKGRLGQAGAGLPYSEIAAAVYDFNAADSADAKNQASDAFGRISMTDNIRAGYRHSRGSKLGWFKSSLAFATALVCCFAAASCSKPSDEERVRETFHVYMEAWKKGDLNTVWRLMSVRLKRGNDNSIENFKTFTKSQGFTPSGYKIEQVEVSEKTAQVRATILFQDSRGRGIGGEREECRLIFAGNRWYFDDCKPSGSRL